MIASTNSPRHAVLLAIGQEEILEGHLATGVAMPQVQGGAESDHGGAAVADGRAVGDVAAQRRRRADLCRAVAAQHRAKGGELRVQCPFQLGDGCHGADVPARVRLGDAAQVGAVVEKDHLTQIAHLFGDPEPDVGGPGDQRGLRVGSVEIRERIRVLRLVVEEGRCPLGPLGRFPRSVFGQER